MLGLKVGKHNLTEGAAFLYVVSHYAHQFLSLMRKMTLFQVLPHINKGAKIS